MQAVLVSSVVVILVLYGTFKAMMVSSKGYARLNGSGTLYVMVPPVVSTTLPMNTVGEAIFHSSFSGLLECSLVGILLPRPTAP